MRKSIKLGAVLLAVGAGSAVATVSAAEHGHAALTATTALTAGSCTALGVTSVIVGWATRRPIRDTEH